MNPAGATWHPDLAELEAVRAASQEIVRKTPIFSSASLSRRCGGRVALKAESLQRTGSFKLRGAAAKLRAGGSVTGTGVVTASAGNHGQALAFAARAQGLPCTVFMPVGAAVAKVEAVSAFGAEVRSLGVHLNESIGAAQELAAEQGLLFVHPFDDLEIVKGQAGIGLELAEQVKDLATVVVPVGGGGLIGGIAASLRAAGSHVRIVGVQAEAYAGFADQPLVSRTDVVPCSPTLADGIAVKRPGRLNVELVDRWVDEMVTVDEDGIAEAMILLAERAKLVVEGAGAAPVGALLTGALKPAASGTTLLILSGGNVDAHVLASVIDRHQTGIGRRTRILTRIGDHPGSLAALLNAVAAEGGNILDLVHVRDGMPRALGETGIELVIENRDADHMAGLLAGMRRAGYSVNKLD